jgi:hypothetical protein
MTMKMNVGVSKKLGLPRYSSVGAMCHLEIELDQSLILLDLDSLHERARQVFAVCRQSVEDELARTQADDCRDEPSLQNDGHPALNGRHDSRDGSLRPASRQQLEYARRLAERIPGLGASRLDALARRLFDTALTELSSEAASELIAILQEMKSGKSDRLAILNGANNGDETLN